MATDLERSLDRSPAGDGGRLLRRSLQLDAVACGALGVVSLAAAPALDDLLGAPLALLLSLGPLLVAWAAALWFMAARVPVSSRAGWAVVLVNLLWVIGSIAAVAAGSFSLTAAGTALVLVQAGAVALLADVQFLGLRRARPAFAG